MLNKDYFDTVARLQTRYSNLKIFDDDDLSRQFNIVSAGLANFLPTISFDKHESIFRDVLLHRHLSILEQDNVEVLQSCRVENFSNETLDLLKSCPAIICTFHLSSYRLINLFLVQQNIPYSLVVSESVVEAQGKVFAESHQRFSNTEISLIAAEAPGSALRMLKELKKGRSLLIYIDGNVGSGRLTADNENSCSVPFLNQKIMARKGIGFLSHIANVPVLPVVCYRKFIHDIRLKFFDFIYPEQHENRNRFGATLVHKIYEIASPYIKKYPEQWEAWLYLPKVAHLINPFPLTKMTAQPSLSGKVLFNSLRFGLFRTPKKNYIFDKSNFISYPIATSLYSLLSSSVNGSVDESSLDTNTFDELCKKEVLITPVLSIN